MSILGLSFLIAGLIALGMFIAYLVAISITWLIDKINTKAAEENVKSIVVTDLEELAENSDNKISLSDLNKITGGRRAEVIASLDEDKKIVGDIEIAKDENATLDPEVEKILGKDGTVVVDV